MGGPNLFEPPKGDSNTAFINREARPLFTSSSLLRSTQGHTHNFPLSRPLRSLLISSFPSSLLILGSLRSLRGGIHPWSGVFLLRVQLFAPNDDYCGRFDPGGCHCGGGDTEREVSLAGCRRTDGCQELTEVYSLAFQKRKGVTGTENRRCFMANNLAGKRKHKKHWLGLLALRTDCSSGGWKSLLGT